MKIGSIDFPQLLVEAARNNQLVVFAGAGVSMGSPANLPSFWRLAQLVAEGSGRTPDDPLDRFLGKLHHAGVNVHVRAAAHLSTAGLGHTSLHESLLQLFGSLDRVRIVTTNFDNLFEAAALKIWSSLPEIYRAPALPLGREFDGLVYVHGSIRYPSNVVLTDSDFGRAYLTEGWAREFLVQVFRHYTVLFVGYSHEDTVLRYLARALPGGESKGRYVLDSESADRAKWDLLGIQLITFEKSSSADYSALYAGIEKLGLRLRRGMFDAKQSISAIANGLPPIDQEGIDEILDALQTGPTTTFFIEKATAVEWLNWLDGHGRLQRVFESNELNETDAQLATWMARCFAVRFPHQLFALLGRHALKLNSALWRSFVTHLATTSEIIPNDVLTRWVTVLLEADLARNGDAFTWQWLADRVAKQNLPLTALRIFDRLIEERVEVKRQLNWADNEEESELFATDLELRNLSDDHLHVNEIWTNALQPNLAQLAPTILSRMVARLEYRHATLESWGRADRNWDRDSYGRSAIEPHTEDRYPHIVDIVIDAARDSLEHLVKTKHSLASGWLDRLIFSEAPLLRRLALYGLRIDGRSGDQKIEIILETISIHEVMLRHELFMLLRESYPSARESIRAKLIAAINAYAWPDKDDAEAERKAAHVKFEWLNWLQDSDSACAISYSALSAIRSRYPELAPREHPDLTHWTGEAGWVSDESPWTIEHLLAQSPQSQIDDLLSFRDSRFLGPTRSGLLSAIEAATKQNIEWSFELASALAAKEAWDSDLWPALLRGWPQATTDKTNAQIFLEWMERADLRTHSRTLATALYEVVKDGGKPYAAELLEVTNRIAAKLWPPPSEADEPPTEGEWLQHAINRPAGILAEYWVNSLSLQVKAQGDTRTLPGEYKREFHTMVENSTLSGAEARTVVASQFAFLHALDGQWARDHVLPFFTSSDTAVFQQAWDGFLSRGRITPTMTSTLKTAFLEATSRIAVELKSNRDRFVEFYVAALTLFVDDPMLEWIPRFFAEADNASRESFAAHLGQMLRDVHDAQQEAWWRAWIARYWDARVQGIPAPIGTAEAEAMFGWAVHLPAVFPSVVEMIERMPKGHLRHSPLLYRLKKHRSLREHPNHAARLLVFLLGCDGPMHAFYGATDVVKELAANSLQPQIKQKLVEALLAKGLDASPLTGQE